MMKFKLFLILFLFPLMIFSQQNQEKNVEKKVMSFLAEAEKHYEKGDMAMAEAAYRKAIAIAPDNDLAKYNFGNLYINYKKENEALLNLSEATKESKNESIKHKSFHNQGNILMEKKKYAQAAKAYKEALKNDPTDDETRYNYALAKELMEKQKQKQNKQNKNKDKNKDKKENKKKQNQNKKGGEGKNEKDKKEEKGKSKDQSKKDKDKKGNPKEDNKQDKKAKQDQQKQSEKQEKKKARKAKLSEQQVKNILKAIENSEKDVQKKLNKKKQEGKPVRTEKDW